MKTTSIILVMAILWAINPQENLFATELQKPIRIAVVEDNPPFSFRLPDGTTTGLYVEFWQLWSETNNIPISIIAADFEIALQAVRNGEVDLHAGLFINKDRQKWADFSQPIHSVKTGVLYRDSSSKMTRLVEMVHRKVSVQVGSFQANYLTENYPDLEISFYRDGASALNQLLNNEIDAIVGEVPYLKARIARLGLSGVFTLSDEELLSNEVHAAVAKGRPELITMLNKGIQNISLNKLIELESKWLPGIKPFFKEKISFSALSLYEIEWLAANPMIRLGIDSAWPPFEFIDENGQYSGITADYVEYAVEKLAIEMVPVSGLSWNGGMTALKAGQIDVMPGVVKTEERAKYLNFTEPIISLPTVIVTKTNTFYAGTMEALFNKKVGIVEGYALVELLAIDYPQIIIQTTDSVSDGLEKLQDGEIDAFIDTISVINYEIEDINARDLMIASFTPYSLELSMAVRKGMEPLVGILNKTFASMDNKQKVAIANSWLSIHVQRGTAIKTILLWAIPITTILLLIIIVIVRINRRMEDEISERQKIEVSLEKAKQLAEAASEAKGDFLANMSHEIRTPLNAVVGMSHLLEESGLNEKQQEYLNTLNISAASLLVLLNDILDLSKIESGKLELEESPFILKQIVRNISQQVLPDIDTNKVTFTEEFSSHLPKILSGDAFRLSQILFNIINNAIKFTEKGEIKLSVSVKEQVDSTIKLLFTVSDTGIGMAEEQLARVFKTYSQADTSTTRQYGGTGLGLSISKNLCGLMGGKIWVESTAGQGSIFSFTIVFNLASEDDPEVKLLLDNIDEQGLTKSSSKPNKINRQHLTFFGKRVLVVDDNHINLLITEKILVAEGIEVTTALNGEDCLQLLDNNSFDAIIMDIQMPVMDGYTATRKIREKPQTENIPIIAFSANAMKQDVQKSIQAGMNAHLGKPLDVDELLECLNKYLA